MNARNPRWARDLFGPLWAWLVIGFGLALMASAYGLHFIGFTYEASLTTFVAGAVIIVTMLTYLCALGHRTWRAWFWVFHTDDTDLIMGRRK